MYVMYNLLIDGIIMLLNVKKKETGLSTEIIPKYMNIILKTHTHIHVQWKIP